MEAIIRVEPETASDCSSIGARAQARVEAHLEGGHSNPDAPKHDQGEQEEQHSQCRHDICDDCPDFAVPSSGISGCASGQLCRKILQKKRERLCRKALVSQCARQFKILNGFVKH